MASHRKDQIITTVDRLARACDNAIFDAELAYHQEHSEPDSRAEAVVYKSAIRADLQELHAIVSQVGMLEDISEECSRQVLAALKAGYYSLATQALKGEVLNLDFDEILAHKISKCSSPFTLIFDKILEDESLEEKMKYGTPRPGHIEGAIGAHVRELHENLQAVVECLEGGLGGKMITLEQLAALRILILCHDTFKGDALRGVDIAHPKSHASLARSYLENFTADQSLLNMIQLHDEPYALFKKWQSSHCVPQVRLAKLFEAVVDWDTFMLFQIIDNTTVGKSTEAGASSTVWLVDQADIAAKNSRDYRTIESFVRDRLCRRSASH
jgi:hypothetical protein